MINSGDTAWVLASSALVLLMTIPGLACYVFAPDYDESDPVVVTRHSMSANPHASIHPPYEMMAPPATMNPPPIRMVRVGGWRNTIQEINCATTKKNTTYTPRSRPKSHAGAFTKYPYKNSTSAPPMKNRALDGAVLEWRPVRTSASPPASRTAAVKRRSRVVFMLSSCEG
jgi:hypothetical protein